jgi:hypothetical protein
MGTELFAASRRPGVHCCGMTAGRPAHRGSQFVRQWRLLRTLEGAKRGMTVAHLREAIEETQSTRTLYRDLEVLQQAGFPLTNEDGAGDCWKPVKARGPSRSIPPKSWP